jgi:hypothetical protein
MPGTLRRKDKRLVVCGSTAKSGENGVAVSEFRRMGSIDENRSGIAMTAFIAVKGYGAGRFDAWKPTINVMDGLPNAQTFLSAREYSVTPRLAASRVLEANAAR